MIVLMRHLPMDEDTVPTVSRYVLLVMGPRVSNEVWQILGALWTRGEM